MMELYRKVTGDFDPCKPSVEADGIIFELLICFEVGFGLTERLDQLDFQRSHNWSKLSHSIFRKTPPCLFVG